MGKTEDVPRPTVHARRMRVKLIATRWGYAMGLLLAVCHAHGPDTPTVFDAGVIIALYLWIHDTR
jgi:hypothetical protein